MGTVLSFSPRERRPVYSTHHHSHHHHSHHHHHNHSSNSSSSSSCRGRTSIGGGGIGIGGGGGGEGGRRVSGGDVGSVHSSCSISSSNSADFQLNNYSYEQLNNVKNRENSKPPNSVNNNNNNHNLNNNINNNLSSTNNTTNTTNLDRTNNNDTARILSEKNALEKNLKKHSLFINALSWKRLASSHGKKKLESNQKNKAANLPTATFRPPLADAIHPLVVDKNKNIQQQPQHQQQTHHQQQQQIQQQQQQQQLHQQQTQIQQHNSSNSGYGYNTPVTQKSALLALDLVRANNTNSLQQPTDKLSTKLPLSLPLSIPIQNNNNNINNNNNTINNHHTQIVQHRQHQPHLQQHNHHNRKTVIQVSYLHISLFFSAAALFFKD